MAPATKRKVPTRLDPTRTATLRRRLLGEMRKRFRALRGAITRLVVEEDAFGLTADYKAGQKAATSPRQAATSRRYPLGTVLNTTGAGGAASRPVVNTRWRFQTCFLPSAFSQKSAGTPKIRAMARQIAAPAWSEDTPQSIGPSWTSFRSRTN